MIAFIGVISFFGLIAFIIMTIINAIRKKPIKRLAIGIAVFFVVFVICLAVIPPVENNQQIDNKEPTESEQIMASKEDEGDNSKEPVKSEEPVVDKELTQSEEITDTVNYDKLQSLFLSFSFETTEDDLIKWIEDNGLKYTSKEYNGSPKNKSYKIAYEDDVALMRHAESGDHVEISFCKENGSFMYAEYFNYTTFKTALLYNYGTYWDFREREENNKYSGYYYHTSGESKGGITIEYSNGNSTETGYYSVENGENTLSIVLNK